MQPGDLDRFIMPDEIEALEYYQSPSTVPIEFYGKGGSTTCGVLVLWTRFKIPPKGRG
jgi:hypothetical protein